MSSQRSDFKNSISEKKIPILITIAFFLITSYVAGFHHDYWVIDHDGQIYLHAGEQILAGNGKNVKLYNIPIDWLLVLTTWSAAAPLIVLPITDDIQLWISNYRESRINSVEDLSEENLIEIKKKSLLSKIGDQFIKIFVISIPVVFS